MEVTHIFSKKQLKLLKLFKNGGLKRINILEGSVRSGKTYISLIIWALFVACGEKNASYLMCAKTLTGLRRNVLDTLENLVGSANFSYSVSKKEGTLFGRKVYLEGASDSRAEGKIRGLTLSGAYCDEITLFSEDFFAMLLSRLSRENSKLIGTTNPDSPRHWFKIKYLNRKNELNMLVMKFLIDDNPFLPKEYVKNLKKEYTGIYYDRFIKGEWKSAEGIIYRDFAENPDKFKYNGEKIELAVIGVDFGGNMSAHSFVCSGFTKNFEKTVCLDEFYIKEKISPDELEKYFVEFVRKCKKEYPLYEVYCDNAETTLIMGLSAAAANYALGVDVRPAKKKKICDRISFYTMMMSQGRFMISDKCPHLADALMCAVWDPGSIADKRLDNGILNVDSLDAMEYSTENYISECIDR